MFGFRKRDRTSDIALACEQGWMEFAAHAAVAGEASIVVKANGTLPDDVHYALRAEMREHVAELIKHCVGEKVELTAEEVRHLTHEVQSRAVERIEGNFPELEVERILSGETGLFVDPLGELLNKQMPQAMKG